MHVAGRAMSGVDRATAVHLAKAALARLARAEGAHEDALLVCALDCLGLGGDELDARPLLDSLSRRRMSYGRENALRYRWGLSHRSEPGHLIYRSSRTLEETHWRPAERQRLAADPSAYGRRLMEPVTIAAHLRFWGQLADAEPDTELGALAAGLLVEAQPSIENDVATWFQAQDPWRDTFGLWLLTAEPQAMTRLRDLLFALAVRYGGIAARDGVVKGLRYPFHGVPLVSASAHLAAGLWRTGIYPTVIPGLVSSVRTAMAADGAWDDGEQPTDVLTTLAAADLLSRLDPDFDPGATTGWLIARQEPGGLVAGAQGPRYPG